MKIGALKQFVFVNCFSSIKVIEADIFLGKTEWLVLPGGEAAWPPMTPACGASECGLERQQAADPNNMWMLHLWLL